MRFMLTVATLAVVLAATPTAAQSPPMRSAPAAIPLARTVPDAVDEPYPGVIALTIDATDVQRGIYRVTETIPVAPGTQRLTLLLPEWLPGTHGPRGTLAELADIRFLVDGKPVKWTREPVEVFAFHLDLPAGTREVAATFVHTSPLQGSEGRITMTREMLNLQWEKMSLYPAGHYVRRIRVKPTVTFPAGWTAAAALDGASGQGGTVTWVETDYETLVDSPIFAGAHYRKWDLGHGVTLNTVADEPGLLDAKPANIARLRALIDEALAAFGSRHFDRYEFLVALTDRMGAIGLEHHRSSENQLEPKGFVEWEAFDWDRNVLAHELSHSWVGKFRRPARLWTPDYRQPMQDNLLWVYEGQNQFWGLVLSARSGAQSKDTVLGMVATAAGLYSEQPGRGWRSVEDTTHDPIFANRKPKPYLTLARGEDYYNEGALVWLEADQIIREGTGGKRGLDDFARAFFGIRDGDWGEVTFEFDDVVATLNRVHPYDWAGFLRQRMQQPDQPAPLAGIARAGYRLVWKDKPNPYDEGRFAYTKTLSLQHSLGLSLDKEGAVTATMWNSPAFNAGIVTGAKIVAVDGAAYDPDKLKAAIAAAKGGERPIELLVQRGERFLTVPVKYAGGLRWPWLERAGPGEQGLDRLLRPRRGGAK
jgi:predicted metalloprotease with PDZ domain